MSTAHDEYRQVLADACPQDGLNDAGAQAIRIGENAILRLPGRVVVRIARPGHLVVAAKEVRIARWLAHSDVPAVRALDSVQQPLEINGQAVTFWEELPRTGTARPPRSLTHFVGYTSCQSRPSSPSPR